MCNKWRAACASARSRVGHSVTTRCRHRVPGHLRCRHYFRHASTMSTAVPHHIALPCLQQSPALADRISAACIDIAAQSAAKCRYPSIHPRLARAKRPGETRIPWRNVSRDRPRRPGRGVGWGPNGAAGSIVDLSHPHSGRVLKMAGPVSLPRCHPVHRPNGGCPGMPSCECAGHGKFGSGSRPNGTHRFRHSYTNGYLHGGSMQVEALELFMWGTLVALTLIFLGLSVMLWRDID